MNRSLLFPLLLLVATGWAVFAQEDKPALAILDVTPLGVAESQSSIVYGYIVDQVNRSGSYRIVERSQLKKAMEELALSAGDLIDESTAAKVGEFAGAQYILLSSLAVEGGKFYLTIRMIKTETAEVTNTSARAVENFRQVEQLTKQSVSYLLGRTSPRGPLERYFSAGIGFGLTVPLSVVSEVLGFGYTPLVALDYNLGLAWGIVGMGLVTGSNITFTRDSTPVAYGLYSIPLAAALKYRTNFKSPGFLEAEVAPGAAVNMLRYSESGINENSRMFVGTTFFLSARLGGGLRIGQAAGLSISASFIFMTTDPDPYLGISPGVQLSFRL